MIQLSKRFLYISASVLLIILLIYISSRYSSDEISQYISKAGAFAPILYITILIIGQIFAPLSTSALFVAGFIVFGKYAILYAIITWLVSSITNFFLARVYGKRILKTLIGDEGILKIEKIAEEIDDKKFLILRVSTFYINDFASYAFGLTKISFYKYYIATILSMIPWSLIMLALMKEGEPILFTTLKILIGMIPFATLSYIFLKKKNK